MHAYSRGHCTRPVRVNIGESVGLVRRPSLRRIWCPAELDEGGVRLSWKNSGHAQVRLSCFFRRSPPCKSTNLMTRRAQPQPNGVHSERGKDSIQKRGEKRTQPIRFRKKGRASPAIRQRCDPRGLSFFPFVPHRLAEPRMLGQRLAVT